MNRCSRCVHAQPACSRLARTLLPERAPRWAAAAAAMGAGESVSATYASKGEKEMRLPGGGGGESFMRVHWVAVPEVLRARRVNRRWRRRPRRRWPAAEGLGSRRGAGAASRSSQRRAAQPSAAAPHPQRCGCRRRHAQAASCGRTTSGGSCPSPSINRQATTGRRPRVRAGAAAPCADGYFMTNTESVAEIPLRFC
jgi:hypothetical protein